MPCESLVSPAGAEVGEVLSIMASRMGNRQSSTGQSLLRVGVNDVWVRRTWLSTTGIWITPITDQRI